jgi:hypothetical protein
MKIYLIISADTLPLETERCWLLGLLAKELVTNAVRHACFLDTREGKISIELTWEGTFVHCAVSDNGPGMARARPVRDFRIAHNLARGLGGRIGHWFYDEGTSFVVTFPFTERELQEIRTPALATPASRIEPARDDWLGERDTSRAARATAVGEVTAHAIRLSGVLAGSAPSRNSSLSFCLSERDHVSARRPLPPVPVGNLIWLVNDPESGDAAV